MPTTRVFAERRCQQDLGEIRHNNENSSIIFVEPIGDDYLHLEAAITGPISTPYENEIFCINIKLSEEYPFSPPQSIIFKHDVVHPNINEINEFMSELLTLEFWLPTMGIRNILEHVWTRLAIFDIGS
ncbi:unnamed protein product [Rotaria socialis]|uniref:UBC core domain-containing protein n=1 Tax=Rotaria socialis TaxID=392032 RepID=A0A817U0P6_9BILA|nr:unnamed protein product [Rotaria socialis]CAF3404357.1 unnamed protein product [Rotaria socialis]CAF4686791.1 unnamed protein product [Rotaria socialis]